MSKVFVSWYDGQSHNLANQFLGLLKKHGFDVEHSPFSPHSGIYDERWENWYEVGLPKSIKRAEIFVAVITPSCDGSTWMMVEYEEAYNSFVKTAKPVLFYISFDLTEKQVKCHEHYFSSSICLSSVPEEAVRTLLISSSQMPT